MRRDVIYAAALLVLAAALVYLFVPLELPKIGGQTAQKTTTVLQNSTFEERLKKFIENNPNANESYARDVVYHDLAIESRNASMCDAISDTILRNDCSFYFQVASR